MESRSLVFEGSHYQIGEEIGQIYKSLGKKEVYLPPLVDEYYRKQLSLYQKFYPKYLEFLEGVSEGLGIQKDTVLKSYLTGYLSVAHKKENNKCSTFFVKNSKGIFVGRNYDWLESSEANSKLIQCDFNDSNKIHYISDMGTWKFATPADPSTFLFIADDAWNEHGLYISLSGAPGVERSFGMSTPHVVQLIAETCKTTEEAIELLKQIPIPDPKIFSVADSKGNFATVEKRAGLETKVIRAEDIQFSTNHYNHPDFFKYNEVLFQDVPFHSTWSRYNYLKLLVEKDKKEMDFDKIISIMNRPPVLQNWRGEANGDVLTIWILALNLKNLDYKVIFEPLREFLVYAASESRDPKKEIE